jgi:O-antigen ligase
MLQGEARGWLYDLSGEARLTRFMHNGYLYLAVKMGLPAAAVFAGFALSFLAAGVAAYRRVRGRWAGTLVLPVVAAFLGLLEWSIFEAHLMLAPGMAAVGLMVALAGAALDLDEEEVALEPTPEAERYLVVAGPAPLVP